MQFAESNRIWSKVHGRERKEGRSRQGIGTWELRRKQRRSNTIQASMRRPHPMPHFSKFAAVTFGASIGLGYSCLLCVERINPNATADIHTNATSDASPSRDEALVRAMIQNAKESSWQENLRNAVMAQERFVLPERHPARITDGAEHGESKEANPRDLFVQKIVARSDRWLQEQHAEQARRQKQQRDNAESFSTAWGQDDDKSLR